MNDNTRKSISATLAEIEQSEVRERIADITLTGDYLRPDSDALEAWEILGRIANRVVAGLKS